MPTVWVVQHGTRATGIERDGIDDVLDDLARIWPALADELLQPLEEDAEGTCHDIRRQVRCKAPARVVEVPLRRLLTGEKCCSECVPPALLPGGRLAGELASRTLCLRVALDERVTAVERATAAVLTVWSGPSRYLPQPVFDRIRRTTLLPLLGELAVAFPGGGDDATGPLVAFTAGDMRLGMNENPECYRQVARSAAPALLHASPRDGVWLLHDPYRVDPGGTAERTGLGTVLLPSVRRGDIDPVACEIFGVLADDALAGLSSWEDIRHWWFAANRLNR